MRKIIYLSFTVTVLFICGSTFAQSSIFIKALDNNGVILNGGSKAPGHINQIEALAYSNGFSFCTSCTKANFQDLSFTMYLNNPASIQAKMLLVQGLHLQSVDVYFRISPATFDYYDIHMEDVIISSFSEGGTPSDYGTVNITFTPAKIAWQYTAPKPADNTLPGTKTKGGWDIANNVAYSYF